MQLWLIIAAIGALLGAFGGVQSWRVEHIKKDLEATREAQVDPSTKMSWQSEYLVGAANLATCKSNTSSLQDAVTSQNSALEGVRARDAQRNAAIASARQAAQKSAMAAQSAGVALESYRAKGADVCSRLLDADAKVKEMTR